MPQQTTTQESQVTSIEHKCLPLKVLSWAADHHLDFDFNYLKETMSDDEMVLYKQSVIEETITFFMALAKD